jgi:transcriptional regulator with XRE-family HTH domain
MDKDYGKLIKSKGLKKIYIAEKLGISRVTLRNKLIGKTEFTKPEKFMLDAILRGEQVD